MSTVGPFRAARPESEETPTLRGHRKSVEFDPELTFVRKPSLRHTYLPERVVQPFTLLEKSRIFGRIHFCL